MKTSWKKKTDSMKGFKLMFLLLVIQNAHVLKQDDNNIVSKNCWFLTIHQWIEFLASIYIYTPTWRDTSQNMAIVEHLLVFSEVRLQKSTTVSRRTLEWITHILAHFSCNSPQFSLLIEWISCLMGINLFENESIFLVLLFN